MVKIESSTAVVLDDSGTITVAELVEQSGLSEDELAVLVDCGALEPREREGASWRFSAHCVVTARTARRLRDDFALDDTHALAILLRLMQRIENLELELRRRRWER
ncbi:MAG TPA: chaperone modulator CbpM [Casimicrobiaceae bacterium]|nr:chaperone modulator CbpM [Casimicrobiaceae bacterium]